MKKVLSILTAISLLLCLASCSKKDANQTNEKIDGINISLSDNEVTINGVKATSNSTDDVYTANDIVYYESGHDFTYGDGDENDEHSKEEADSHTVVHITKAGTYVLSGKLSKGQIAVDLGEDAKSNPEAKVTLILNGVDITSTVAPSIIFYNVYECGNSDTEGATKNVDTKDAGANIKIADDTENTLNGSYVAKIYKSVVLSEDGKEITESKKLHKYDGTLYSKMTMNIDGDTGILNVNAENEGIDSELHLTVNGGIINIVSGDDGINTNEDGVSVTTINGGTLNIKISENAKEGDGIDSNGWLVINGGNVFAQACSTSGDAGIDSDNGIYINGGTIIATGNMLDEISGGAQNYAVFTFNENQKEKCTYEVKNSKGESVITTSPDNSFTYLIVSSPNLTGGEYSLYKNNEILKVSASSMNMGFGGQRPDMNGEMPENNQNQNGNTPPELPNGDAPQRPNEQQPNGSTPPEKPNGEENPNANEENLTNASETFEINAGGNTFMVF